MSGVVSERERGAVLLVVLVALTLLAGLAAASTRNSRSALTALAAERAVMAREVLLQSALAALALRISGEDALPRNGKPEIVPLPGGRAWIGLQAAAGLLNPNSTREPALLSGLLALGARPEVAAALVNAIMERRRAHPGAPAFSHRSELDVLFARAPDLWPRAAAMFTLLGNARDLDPATAPAPLQPIATDASAGFDLSAVPGRLERSALYEVELGIEPDGLGRQVTHAAILIDRAGRLHLLRLDWPGGRSG